MFRMLTELGTLHDERDNSRRMARSPKKGSTRKASVSLSKQRNTVRKTKREEAALQTWDPDVPYFVEYIKSAKLVILPGGKRIWAYRVKWHGYPTSDNTWEPASSFEHTPDPIVEKFWMASDFPGKPQDEPDPGKYRGKRTTFHSKKAYRAYETLALAPKSSRGKAAKDSQLPDNSIDAVEMALEENSESESELESGLKSESSGEEVLRPPSSRKRGRPPNASKTKSKASNRTETPDSPKRARPARSGVSYEYIKYQGQNTRKI